MRGQPFVRQLTDPKGSHHPAFDRGMSHNISASPGECEDALGVGLFRSTECSSPRPESDFTRLPYCE